MSDLLELPFRPEHGKPSAAVLHRFLDAVSRAGDARLLLTLTVQKRSRSLNQNSFYRGPFIEAFRTWLLDCGQRLSEEQIHEGLKARHAKNGYSVPLPDGSLFKVPPSTSRFSTQEMEDYLTEIRAAYAPYGFIGPFPNEQIE